MIKIKPRIFPKNITDIFLLIPAFAIQVLILFLIPGYLLWLISGNEWFIIIYSFLLWGYFVFASVHSLKITDEGINFNRLIGNPNIILWENLESVSVSTPLNTIIYGWLWPPIPANEMTFSCSTFDHLQITYEGGKRVFFPPQKVNELLEIINNHKVP